MKLPEPRAFTNFDDYELACMNAISADMPRPDPSDETLAASMQRMAIYDAEDDVKEVAREKWTDYLDHCEDMWERGVGPAWEDA